MIFCRYFLSHGAEKNVEESFRVLFTLFTFGYRKIFCFRGVGHDFFSNTFCPTRPKKM